jgi:hypothetical protein
VETIGGIREDVEFALPAELARALARCLQRGFSYPSGERHGR